MMFIEQCGRFVFVKEVIISETMYITDIGGRSNTRARAHTCTCDNGVRKDDSK